MIKFLIQFQTAQHGMGPGGGGRSDQRWIGTRFRHHRRKEYRRGRQDDRPRRSIGSSMFTFPLLPKFQSFLVLSCSLYTISSPISIYLLIYSIHLRIYNVIVGRVRIRKGETRHYVIYVVQ